MPLAFAVRTLEEVPEAARGFYIEDKDVGFKLDTTGIEDPEELRRAKAREVEARKVAETKLAKLESEQAARDKVAATEKAKREEEVRLAKEDALRKDGNIDELEKSWTQKLNKALADKDAEWGPQVESLNTDVTREMIDRHATEIAASLALPESADVLYPHIRARLRVEIRDGKRQTVVVDKDGKASALTLADLRKEFAAMKGFAPILAASRASGGGANGGRGGGATDGSTMLRAEFEALNAVEKHAFLVKNKGKVVDPQT